MALFQRIQGSRLPTAFQLLRKSQRSLSSAPLSDPSAVSQESVAFESNAGNLFFSQYNVYKTGFAMNLSFIRPLFRINKGTNVTALHKEGVILLKFAKATSDDPKPGSVKAGEKRYFWESGHYIALSAAEAAAFLTGAEKFSFYHDPNKGKATEGQLTKALSVEATSAGIVLMLNIGGSSLADKENKPYYKIQLSPGEALVFKSTLEYGIPRILGFDKAFE